MVIFRDDPASEKAVETLATMLRKLEMRMGESSGNIRGEIEGWRI